MGGGQSRGAEGSRPWNARLVKIGENPGQVELPSTERDPYAAATAAADFHAVSEAWPSFSAASNGVGTRFIVLRSSPMITWPGYGAASSGAAAVAYRRSVTVAPWESVHHARHQTEHEW